MSGRKLTGVIVSNKMTNTVVVEIERKIQHPMYKKFIKRTKNFKADINGLTLNVGDVVVMQETRPMSRDKHFKVIEKVKGVSK